jgi:1,4-dihydroxy-2-naphthoate polyprenyltransferase
MTPPICYLTLLHLNIRFYLPELIEWVLAVQWTEREFRATQPIPGEPQERKEVQPKLVSVAAAPPRSLWRTLGILTRAETIPAIVAPALVGAVLAWWQIGQFDWLIFLLTLSGVISSGLGFNALSDYYDHRYSVRAGKPASQDPYYTGYDLLRRGLVAPKQALDVGHILLSIGFLCVLWLVVLAGWPILFFAGMGFLLLYTVLLMPLKYGTRGWGVGEVGIFLSMGLLPMVGSFYVQAHALDPLPILSSVPFGIMTTLIYFNYNAIHYRRDWLMRKRTLTVNLGLERAADTSIVLTVCAYVAILLLVTLTQLPLLALVALGSLPVGLSAFAQIQRTHLNIEDTIALYASALNATVLTALLFSGALILSRLL